MADTVRTPDSTAIEEIAERVTQALEERPGSTPGLEQLSLRAVRAMMQLLHSSQRGDVLAALSEGHDVEVLVHLIEHSPELLESETLGGFSVEERVRSLQLKRELLTHSDGVLSVSEAARLLGIQEESVRQRIRRGRLLAVRMTGPEYLIPGIQFTDAGVLRGLADVLAALPVDDPWAKLSDLTEPLEALRDESGPRSIADALRAGETERAVAAASFLRSTGGA